MINQSGTCRSDYGSILRNLMISRDFVVDRYDGNVPFSVPTFIPVSIQPSNYEYAGLSTFCQISGPNNMEGTGLPAEHIFVG